jgi:hypothetical protein
VFVSLLSLPRTASWHNSFRGVINIGGEGSSWCLGGDFLGDSIGFWGCFWRVFAGVCLLISSRGASGGFWVSLGCCEVLGSFWWVLGGFLVGVFVVSWGVLGL